MRKIAFLGTGIMGAPMARNVLASGIAVAAWNRSAVKAQALEEDGATVAASPASAASGAEAAVCMLTGPEAVDAVLFGAEGVFSAAAPPPIVVNMSTVPPDYSRALAARVGERGATLVDAPVSGSLKPAIDGQLVILASGPEGAIDAVEPAFAAMGKKTVRCGDAGAGSAMKMMINLLLAVCMGGMAEAVHMGRRCGLSTEAMLDVILSGAVACKLFELKAPMFRSGEFPPQFPLKHMLKDMRFILRTADEAGAPAPAGHAAFQLLRQAAGMGLADNDFAATFEALAARADRD
ncbi:MAG: NAD(P)-dependent oxidoreductase [Desulfovibrionaceae bacterium]|nr:NAD(P)-dependent oxidoreductase [Desulfovibrionaceae bacterium]